MWVLNSMVFLIPAVVIAVKELSPRLLMHSAARESFGRG
jgi:hypothetical protein